MRENRGVQGGRGRRWGLAAAALLLGSTVGGTAVAAGNIVVQWEEAAANANAHAYHLAMVQVAVHDTLQAIDGRYRPFAVLAKKPVGPISVEAAVSEAAYRVLVGLNQKYSSPALQLAGATALYDTTMQALPDDAARSQGRRLGAAVAAALLAQRASDGWPMPNAVPPDPPDGTAPGEFQRTAPLSRPLVTPWMPNVRPFVLRSASQFRPGGPPAFGSARYAAAFAETKEFGQLNSASRSPDQTNAAWIMTTPPFRFWSSGLRDLATRRGLDVVETARFLATANVAAFDATIACWDAKYFYYAWRPTTAIRRADEDGNPSTVADAGWTPQFATPQHPEYPAAHACAAGSISQAVETYFGTRDVTWTFTGAGPTTPYQRTYTSTTALVQDATNGRIWGGMHFRFSVEDGESLGRQVAEYALARGFGNAGHNQRVNW